MITSLRRKRVTLEDIARLAGVSRNTVSNVLNGRPVVRARLRDRVLAAVRELDYYPNHLARQLVTRRTHTIGVFLPATPGVLLKYFIAEILSGAIEAAARFEYDLHVHSQYGRAADPIDLRVLRDTRIDAGLLIDDGRMTVTNMDEIERTEIPFLVAGYDLNHPNTNSILIDKEEGSYQVVRAMLDRGRRDVAILHGLLPRKDHRFDGYRRALLEGGLQVRDALIADFAAEDWGEHVGAEATRALLARDRTFDGLFAPGVSTATGAARALTDNGLRVPDDVMIGCLGNAPWQLSPPVPLLIAAQPNAGMGAQAVRCLVGIVEGTVRQPVRQTLPCSLRAAGPAEGCA